MKTLDRIRGKLQTTSGWSIIDQGEDGIAAQFRNIRVIASWGHGWDHVSVSTQNRTPSYEEMEMVRGVFFEDHECAVQYSVPREDHINCHPYCLHFWRPQTQDVPRPPYWMVAPRGNSPEAIAVALMESER